jgi:hypothetical protein
MVSLVGNYFVGDDPEAAVMASCNYCDRVSDTSAKYDYCFQCNCWLCKECLKEYANYDKKTNWLCVQREDVATKIKDQNQLVS